MPEKNLIAAVGPLFVLICVTARNVQFVSYDGYRIYKVCDLESKILALEDFALNEIRYRKKIDFSGKTLKEVSYLVPPDDEPDFLNALFRNNLVNYNVTVSDLGRMIEEETKALQSRRLDGKVDFTENYHSYDEIIEFIHQLKEIKFAKTSQSLVEIEKIGKSYENRDMFLVKVSTNHLAEKPVILFEAGIHAREWSSPATMLYMLDQLVKNHTHHMEILDVIDFYVIPVSNPDGYEYSRNHDRFWRKTRSVQGDYRGVDGNRNFGFQWDRNGSSTLPWSEIFRGPEPFSEVETRNIKFVGMKYVSRIKTFISVHAYGPFILHPWSYAVTDSPPQHKIMDMMARDAARAIYEFSKTKYEVGESAKIFYDSPGSVDDYFKGVLGIDLTFTFEISSAEEYSFVVPPYKIVKIASEVFEGFKVMAKHAARYKGK